jgi:hypothetical protein
MLRQLRAEQIRDARKRRTATAVHPEHQNGCRSPGHDFIGASWRSGAGLTNEEGDPSGVFRTLPTNIPRGVEKKGSPNAGPSRRESGNFGRKIIHPENEPLPKHARAAEKLARELLRAGTRKRCFRVQNRYRRLPPIHAESSHKTRVPDRHVAARTYAPTQTDLSQISSPPPKRHLKFSGPRASGSPFLEEDFFDAHDLAQVKYEMLRRVRREGTRVSQAASSFGCSRPSFYGLLDDRWPGYFFMT